MDPASLSKAKALRADLGCPSWGEFQRWFQRQVVSGMSVPIGSWDLVANWGPAAQLVPTRQVWADPKIDKELSVWGKGMDFGPWGNWREDKLSPELPTLTCRKAWQPLPAPQRPVFRVKGKPRRDKGLRE